MQYEIEEADVIRLVRAVDNLLNEAHDEKGGAGKRYL